MKTKILIDFETFGQTAQMTLNNLKSLSESAPMEVRAKESKKITSDDIKWSDIVLSVRGMSCFTTYIAKLCKKYGCIHIYELDDNLFNLVRKDKFMIRRQKELQQTLNYTSILWSPNPLLAEYACSRSNVKRYACTGWIIHDGDVHFVTDVKNSDVFKIVYYSNDGSSDYFWKTLGDVLPKIKSIINKKIIVEAIGMQDSKREIDGCEIIYIPHLSLVDFRHYLSNGNFNVGLAPLIVDDGFSKYKYANKYFELSMAGIVGIYSNCPPYTFVIKDKINGFLVNNTTEDWLNAIKVVAENPKLVFECVKNAQKELETDFSEAAVFSSLINQIPELTTYHAPDVKVKSLIFIQLKYFLFRIFERINSLFLALFNGGPKEALNKTKRYIKAMRGMKKELHE